MHTSWQLALVSAAVITHRYGCHIACSSALTVTWSYLTNQVVTVRRFVAIITSKHIGLRMVAHTHPTLSHVAPLLTACMVLVVAPLLYSGVYPGGCGGAPPTHFASSTSINTLARRSSVCATQVQYWLGTQHAKGKLPTNHKTNYKYGTRFWYHRYNLCTTLLVPLAYSVYQVAQYHSASYVNLHHLFHSQVWRYLLRISTRYTMPMACIPMWRLA
jgi:hypothetical protein